MYHIKKGSGKVLEKPNPNYDIETIIAEVQPSLIEPQISRQLYFNHKNNVVYGLISALTFQVSSKPNRRPGNSWRVR